MAYLVKFFVCAHDVSISVSYVVVDSVDHLSLYIHNFLDIAEHAVDKFHVLAESLDVLLSGVSVGYLSSSSVFLEYCFWTLNAW